MFILEIVNKLPNFKRVQIINLLSEGASMRSIAGACGVSINSVAKLQTRAGEVCLAIHDQHIKNVKTEKVRGTETWSFRNLGQKDIWTWSALDTNTELIVSFFSGRFDAHHASLMVQDLRSRIANSVDFAVQDNSTFLGQHAGLLEILEKSGAAQPSSDRSLEQDSRAFIKKLTCYRHALALYFVYHNFVRVHKKVKSSPALAAGIADTIWSAADIIAEIDQNAEY
jgi:hypothetical protein